MSYPLIGLLQQKAIPVQQSYRVLEVSRSGFYEARSRFAKPMIFKTSAHLRAAFMAVINAMQAVVWSPHWKRKVFKLVAIGCAT